MITDRINSIPTGLIWGCRNIMQYYVDYERRAMLNGRLNHSLLQVYELLMGELGGLWIKLESEGGI
jgi:hypothetical protein